MTEARLVEELLAFIAAGEADEEAFNRMALAVFAHQFETNAPYRRFATQRARTLRTVKSWRDVPAVPISAFKDLTLSGRPPEECPHVFMTSGTTKGVRGKSHHPTLAVYDRSMTVNFRRRFMANSYGGDHDRLRMGILFPTEQAMPNSSLAHYLALAKNEFGTDESRYLITDAGLDVDGAIAELSRAEETGEPYALLGASFSVVHLMDALAERGRSFALPAGSRILDTGGFKGQSREMAAEEFYGRLSATFGVPRRLCINMYGMTELSTQFYDDGNETCPSVKSGPHWIRSRVINPLTGQEVPRGSVGVLVHHDLAHFNCASAILTEDAGVEVDGGFQLLGRADGADAKGCSMAVEDFLKAARAP
ncbi:long-chain fatty acid--CoA ligase [Azospirillum brasilense]|uniref:Long-chain fatty acid--CoA ligase n=1 Tax=Azospirillum brasilense TaxID=192 RepID=A0A6L3AWI6_AZOBR|nr:long-chain fatty acid--CoA ligase [Azospirillum brasilense]KAA0682181.1 long-chain fatty acid--CoA ligase [Azospirillum brasilense]